MLHGVCDVAMGVFFARTGIDCEPHTVRHHGCWRCRSRYMEWIIRLSQARASFFLRNGTDLVLSYAQGHARADGRKAGRADHGHGQGT